MKLLVAITTTGYEEELIAETFGIAKIAKETLLSKQGKEIPFFIHLSSGKEANLKVEVTFHQDIDMEIVNYVSQKERSATYDGNCNLFYYVIDAKELEDLK